MAVSITLSDIIDINDFKGRLAVTRLLCIAQKTIYPQLAQEALLAAVPIIKSATFDTESYLAATNQLFKLQRAQSGNDATKNAPGDAVDTERMDVDTTGSLSKSPVSSKIMSSSIPASTSISSSFGVRRQMTASDSRVELTGIVDEAWLTETSRVAHTERQKLEAELKQYQSNLIKESCRLTYHSIATHQRMTGDMVGALRTYTKAREFNSNAQHELECSMGIIEVSIDLGSYNQILPAVVKAETSLTRIIGVRGNTGGDAQNLTGAQARERAAKMKELDEQMAKTTVKLRAAKGLAMMGHGNFEEAAREFAGIQGKLEDWEGKILTSADVAIYLSFSALAAWGRSAIKSMILDNSDLRPYIEQEAARHARQMLECFVDAKYAKLSEIMTGQETCHKLNPHLAPQLGKMQQVIRQRSIVQYFKPFATVRLERMYTVFGSSTADSNAQLLQDITDLIESGRLDARLDMIDQILHTSADDPRKALFHKAIQVGDEVEKANYKAHLRMLLTEGRILIDRPNKGKGKNRGGQNNDDDDLSMDSDLELMDAPSTTTDRAALASVRI